MHTEINLEPSQVPPQIVATFGRRKYRVRVAESVTVPADAGLWSDGSGEVYHAVMLANGAAPRLPGQASSPWSGARKDTRVDLRPGFAIAQEIMFCGRDHGVVLWVHPADAAPMLITSSSTSGPGPTATIGIPSSR